VVALGIARQPPESRGPTEILLLTVLGDGALLLVVFALGRVRLGLRPGDLGFRTPTAAAIRYAVFVAAGLWLLSIAVNAASIRIFGPHPQSLVVTVGAHSGAAAYALDMFTGALVAPFAEETFYRGLVFAGLAQRLPLWAAAAVSALLFALSHGLGVVLPIFILGLGLAYVYARTGTIWASMTAHSLVNAVSLTLLFLQPRP
jgi:membrane protease YdiL (CAAX protease family)